MARARARSDLAWTRGKRWPKRRTIPYEGGGARAQVARYHSEQRLLRPGQLLYIDPEPSAAGSRWVPENRSEDMDDPVADEYIRPEVVRHHRTNGQGGIHDAVRGALRQTTSSAGRLDQNRAVLRSYSDSHKLGEPGQPGSFRMAIRQFEGFRPDQDKRQRHTHVLDEDATEHHQLDNYQLAQRGSILHESGGPRRFHRASEHSSTSSNSSPYGAFSYRYQRVHG